MATQFFTKSGHHSALDTTASRRAASFDAIPAAILGDQVAAIPASRGRRVVRLLVVISVFLAVIGLTVAKYLSDDSLRSAVYISRETNIDSITAEDAASGLCPCQKQWIAWGEFVSLAQPANSLVEEVGAAQYLAAQCRSLVNSGSAHLINSSAAVPSPPSSPLFKRQYARDAAVRLCEQTLSIIIPALRNVSDVDTLTSPALLSPRLAQRAYTIYAGNTVIAQLRSALLAYDALATAAETVVTAAGCVNSTAANCSAVVATLRDANAPLTREIAVGQAALNEVAATILFENNGTTTSALMRNMTTALGEIDWALYKGACKPIYCDVFLTKNVINRLVEFLAVIGGLWQTVLFIGIMIWILIGFLARFEDHVYLF